MIRKGLVLAAAVALVGAPAAYAFPPDPIDMTVAGAVYTSLIDGTVWFNLKGGSGAIQPAGTGIYDPFLREHALGNGPTGDNGIEYGINTDGVVAEPYDNVGNDPHTHSVLFGDIGVVTYNGQQYLAFSLDLNEPSGGGQNLLSLERIKIYSVDGSAGGSLVTEAQVMAAAGSTLHYDMDGTSDQTTWLDYNNSNTDKDQGSGVDDMNLLIPLSFFAGVQASDYMYFLADFGQADWYGEDGFEEWRVMHGSGQTPEPGTIALLGLSLVGLAGVRRRK